MADLLEESFLEICGVKDEDNPTNRAAEVWDAVRGVRAYMVEVTGLQLLGDFRTVRTTVGLELPLQHDERAFPWMSV